MNIHMYKYVTTWAIPKLWKFLRNQHTHLSTRPSFCSEHTEVPLEGVPQLLAQPESQEASVWGKGGGCSSSLALCVKNKDPLNSNNADEFPWRGLQRSKCLLKTFLFKLFKTTATILQAESFLKCHLLPPSLREKLYFPPLESGWACHCSDGQNVAEETLWRFWA